MKHLTAASLSLLLVSLSAGAAWIARPATTQPLSAGAVMSDAARHFLAGLTPERKTKVSFAFKGPERHDWRFVPGEHHGLTLADMTDVDRWSARELIRTSLSGRGTLKVEAVMAMESVLRDLEHGNPTRDPMKYSIALFGTPDDDAPWAWHLEGHHLSINFTCVRGEVASVTPYFLGSNPGEVRAGPTAGVRILAAEEDLARELVASLSPEQRVKALIAEAAPADVLSLPGRPINALWPELAIGLAVGDLSPEQRRTFDDLLAEYTHNLRGPLAEAEMSRIREAGINAVRFCWAGGLAKNQPHYYRLVGPTFAIEYDNTQNDANHIHTVWHDRTRDFGADALADHVRGDHGE